MGMTFGIRGISAYYLNSTPNKVNYFYHNNGIYDNTMAYQKSNCNLPRIKKKKSYNVKIQEEQILSVFLKEHGNTTISFNFQISGFNIIRKDRENENWGDF